ncbi:MAG: alpha-mannosidase [Actinomycetota bacterium]|nr:alpha-mannosidase [Actinomycetota bacterium]
MVDENGSAGRRAARTINIVPHTHWDREWYRPFQSFRMQLVDLLDGLLPELEANPAYAHFMLDGQMAVIDDYLAVRPDQRPAIRRLAASGRLSVGPWFILMDEFLVSGETLVRNMRLGLDRASEYGGAMPVGYLPDMFGHIAQMPQLLAQFGFEHAVVWRGVPSALDAEAFQWTAPDGSTVRAEYLPQGYSNGAVLPDDAKELVARIDQFCIDEGSLVGDPVLWMNGTDHLLPQPWLGRVVAEANDLQDDYRLVVTSLAEHVAAGRTDGLPAWSGELRSGARANLLMGVASNRTDIRQAAARTERAIERVAEPLAALFLRAEQWPAALLHEAWGFMIRNSAHDSICACSVDAVCDAVLHRYAEAGQIAQGVTDRALATVLASAGGEAPAVVVNPSGRERAGLIEVVVTGDEPLPGTQVLSVRPARSGGFSTTRQFLGELVVRAVQENPFIHDVTFDEGTSDGGGGGLTVTLHADGGQPVQLRTGPLRDRLAELAAADPDGVVDVVPLRRPTQKILARVSEVPGFGWRAWEPAELDVDPVQVTDAADGADRPVLTNGLVTVTVDPDDATYSINGLAGLGRLVDDGDAGDTYNWSPPGDQLSVDHPEQVTVTVIERGPLRARLVIDATYRWPERIDGDRRVGEVVVPVRTTLELRCGEDVLRVAIELDNRSKDHRLRAWFPLPTPAQTSQAECAFAVVERGLSAEGGPNEVGLPTFPSRRFVSAGGLTVVHDGLPEYELVDIRAGVDRDPAAHALALTLLRCTGVISAGPMAMRSLPAGPPTPAPGAQMAGPQRVELALHVGHRNPFAVADDVLLPLIAVRPRGASTTTGSRGPTTGSALGISGAEVSSVTRTAGNRLEVRVFNPTGSDTVVDVPGRAGWLVDLRGRASEPFHDSFALRAGGIQTVVLDPS